MSSKIKIVILGGGFGGVYTALRLDNTLARRADIEVILVSRDNFLLFTPMLHEVASGDLNPTDIVNPIRRMLKRVQFVQADVRSIDPAAKRLHCTRDLRSVPLDIENDHLILALGSETNFFGLPGVAENAVTLKTLGDAALLRARVLGILEMASFEPDAAIRKRMLTFVVAGGGFAGVETIGAINDLVHDALGYYPQLAHQEVRVVLIHPGEFVLPELGEKLGRYAQQKLVDRGVELHPRTKVTSYVDSLVAVSSGETVAAATLIWTAGVTPNAVIEQLACKKDRGRLVVDEFLAVRGIAGFWAIGDCAAVPDAHIGGSQPPTAQHALRQARHAAKNIEAVLAGDEKKPFRFSTIGQLASIGHRHGVANILGMNFSGFVAWFLWRGVYLLKLPRLAKKTRVALSWLLEMIFSKDLEQMLTLRDVELISRIATSLRSDVAARNVRGG